MEKNYICPECGEVLTEQDLIYFLKNGEIILGCEICIHTYNAVQWYEENYEKDKLLNKEYE